MERSARETFAMTGDAVLFEALLKPNPPMKPHILLIVLIVVALFNLGFAGLFLLRGAWPVMAFMGADVALLAWAFQASNAAAKKFERVTLTPTQLTVVHQSAKGAASAVEFNPYWVRVDLEQLTAHSNRVFLRSHGRSVQVASFLPPESRRSFAEKLRAALSAARAFHSA